MVCGRWMNRWWIQRPMEWTSNHNCLSLHTLFLVILHHNITAHSPLLCVSPLLCCRTTSSGHFSKIQYITSALYCNVWCNSEEHSDLAMKLYPLWSYLITFPIKSITARTNNLVQFAGQTKNIYRMKLRWRYIDPFGTFCCCTTTGGG